jgi:alpha-ketoglutarate-dependent taurine dioxygenase
MNLSIEAIKPQIGGIVHVGKKDMLDDAVVATLREALEERSVLVFPQINLSDAEQLAFTDKFGKRVSFTKRAQAASGGNPDVYKITLDEEFNKEPEYVLGTYFWHIDGVTIDQPLPKATLLSARKLSSTGGQTEFASTYAAYENLPADEKKALEGLMVVHRMEASMRPMFKDPGDERLTRWRGMSTNMVHPLVWLHKSGR